MRVANSYLVDVIVPFADRLRNLEPLKSLLSSELLPKEIRIILVHDVKTQDTASQEINKLLSQLDPGSYVYVKGIFGSPGAARNAGLEKVTAQWVCFWDSDDYPIPNAFLRMIASTNENQNQVCIGKFEIIDYHDKRRIHTSQGNSRVSVATTPGFWRMAFTRQSIGDVRFTTSRMGEDQLFLMAIDFGSLRWHRHDEIVYRYLVGFDSQLTNLKGSYGDLLETFENSLQVCDRKTGFFAAYIYSIMQIRMAVTIWRKFPIQQSSKSLFKYTLSSISSPKNLVLATIPAYLTVTFGFFLTIAQLAKVKFRGRGA